jgi:hypothetical protein
VSCCAAKNLTELSKINLLKQIEQHQHQYKLGLRTICWNFILVNKLYGSSKNPIDDIKKTKTLLKKTHMRKKKSMGLHKAQSKASESNCE